MRWCVCAWSSPTLRPHELQPTSLLCPWDSPGKNTGIGCHFLLQGIFLTQGSDPCLPHLLHWQVDSLPLSHPGSPSEMMLGIYKAQFVERPVQQNPNTLHPAPTMIHILQLRFIIPPPATTAFQRTSQESVSNLRVHAGPPRTLSQCRCLFRGAGEGLGPCLSHCLPSDSHSLGPGHTRSKILKCLDATSITDTKHSVFFF